MDAKHAHSSTKLQPHCAPIREAGLTQKGSRDVMMSWSHSTERILRAASMKKVERQKVSVVIFILFSVFYFVYGHLVMGVWSAQMYVHHVYTWYPGWPEEGIRFPGVTGSCELPCTFWEL